MSSNRSRVYLVSETRSRTRGAALSVGGCVSIVDVAHRLSFSIFFNFENPGSGLGAPTCWAHRSCLVIADGDAPSAITVGVGGCVRLWQAPRWGRDGESTQLRCSFRITEKFQTDLGYQARSSYSSLGPHYAYTSGSELRCLRLYYSSCMLLPT
jgi:hypothetical protein